MANPNELFIDYVNVLFSSNSQRISLLLKLTQRCLSIMSMFSFQAIHNFFIYVQEPHLLFIDYVNILFSSNSQLVVAGRTPFHWKCCTFENRAVKICTHRTCRAEVGIGEIGTGEVSH